MKKNQLHITNIFRNSDPELIKKLVTEKIEKLITKQLEKSLLKIKN